VAATDSELLVCNLETVEYRAASALQEQLRAARQADELGDVLLLLEHPPVYTRGRRSDPSELPMGESWYLSQGIDVVATDRGGRLTYHGPGQLVGYPIMRIADVVEHLRTMERAIVAALADEGLEARARPDEGADFTGVWIEDRKIASIGVHVARGVSTHGFAVNVENDLQPFEWVVPCGLDGVRMTSLIKERHDPAPGALPHFRATMTKRFAEAFGRTAREVSPETIGVPDLPPVPLTR
jgi:lipoyl(octanoyl) transferase